MNKKLIAVFFAFASLAGYAAAADREVTFDQSGDMGAMLGSAREASQPAVSTPFFPEFTFTEAAERVVYAKGFIKKDLPASMWKSFKDVKVEIPNALDLRPGLTQIENQGSCGSCWAFGLTAAHRDGHALAGKDPGRLSQEWMVNNSTYAAGCQGGYFDSANDIVTPRGQPLWKDCPYKNGNGKCRADLPIAAGIKGWFMLGEKASGPTVKDIEAYMASTGKEIAIAVAAGVGRWQSYSGGVYNACKYGQLDHMINIVGWDNEGAAFDENGNLPPGKGVWILRNSWGTSWGEKGFMRTKMTDAAGKRCNAVAEEAAAYDFGQ